MTAKEYLSQAFYLNMLIRSQLEQIESMHALATKATTVLSDMNVQNSKNDTKLEDIIVKMLDYEEEVKNYMKRLIRLKQEIRRVISGVDNDEYRVLLELRYLSSKRWEEIAVRMGYSVEHIYHMHREALKKLKIPA